MPLSQKTTCSKEERISEVSNSPSLVTTTESEVSTQLSEATNFYQSDDSKASALFVTQIANMLKRGDRKKTLTEFNQFSKEFSGDREEKKNLQVMVSASNRLKETGFAGVKS